MKAANQIQIKQIHGRKKRKACIVQQRQKSRYVSYTTWKQPLVSLLFSPFCPPISSRERASCKLRADKHRMGDHRNKKIGCCHSQSLHNVRHPPLSLPGCNTLVVKYHLGILRQVKKKFYRKGKEIINIEDLIRGFFCFFFYWQIWGPAQQVSVIFGCCSSMSRPKIQETGLLQALTPCPDPTPPWFCPCVLHSCS